MRVVIADDELLIREGLSRLLSEVGFDVVAAAADADDARRKVHAHEPDVLVTDIRMPPRLTDEGLLLAETLHETRPHIGVVVLSQHLESGYAMRLLRGRRSGIGYLLKSRIGDIGVLGDGIRRVGLGGTAIDPRVVELLVNRKRPNDPLADFTARERETLGLMAQGYSNQGIAERLVLSTKTVESHVGRIFKKLDLAPARDDSRRVLAVLTYLRSASGAEGAPA
jgi:DNA-binding NarL/FixJ family response regulator